MEVFAILAKDTNRSAQMHIFQLGTRIVDGLPHIDQQMQSRCVEDRQFVGTARGGLTNTTLVSTTADVKTV